MMKPDCRVIYYTVTNTNKMFRVQLTMQNWQVNYSFVGWVLGISWHCEKVFKITLICTIHKNQEKVFLTFPKMLGHFLMEKIYTVKKHVQ